MTPDPFPSEQTRLIPGLPPEYVIETAEESLGPFVGRVCLFSGGHDSTVVAHRCRDFYDELAFIDTGTAAPGVREFVDEFAGWIGKPLRVLEAGDEYRQMVRQHGFPGPAQHRIAYVRLKERQLERLRNDLKAGHHRYSKVLFLTGVRRAESTRRMTRPPHTVRGSIVFAAPLIDWTAADMRRYRTEHVLPESDVAALIHRSGECNCGCYAQPGEREMMRSLWPEWFDRTIGSLEREAEARGIPACRWGAAPPSDLRRGVRPVEGGPLCASCDFRQMQIEEAPRA